MIKSKFIVQTRLVGPNGEDIPWRDYRGRSGHAKLHDDLYAAIRSRDGYARFCLQAHESSDAECSASIC